MSYKEQIYEFCKLALEIDELVDLDIPWDDKYTFIFGNSGLRSELGKTGIPFYWRSPDGSTKDKVIAFNDALQERVKDFDALYYHSPKQGL